MDGVLFDLARTAKQVSDAALAVLEGHSVGTADLERAMKRYDRLAFGYRGDLTPGDFVRQDAERFEGEMRVAMERIAQLLDQEFNP